jgi:hypothetical protein
MIWDCLSLPLGRPEKGETELEKRNIKLSFGVGIKADCYFRPMPQCGKEGRREEEGGLCFILVQFFFFFCLNLFYILVFFLGLLMS